MAYSDNTGPFGMLLTPWVKRLLLANAAIFLLTLGLPGIISWLAFVPAEVLVRPWTVLTYLFVHADFWHLFFNMLGLFFFGPVLEERWGPREFLKFYLLCGLGGALLSLVFPHSSIIGASGAVYGIMVAYAMYWPDNPIYIWGVLPVKAKWLVLFLVGMSLLSATTGRQSGVAHLAHLGGAAAAFVYLKSGFAPSAWGTVYTSPKAKRRRSFFSRGPKLIATKRSGDAPAPARPRDPAAAQPGLEDINRILDKISSSGIGSLTPDERRRLEEASRRFRTS